MIEFGIEQRTRSGCVERYAILDPKRVQAVAQAIARVVRRCEQVVVGDEQHGLPAKIAQCRQRIFFPQREQKMCREIARIGFHQRRGDRARIAHREYRDRLRQHASPDRQKQTKTRIFDHQRAIGGHIDGVTNAHEARRQRLHVLRGQCGAIEVGDAVPRVIVRMHEAFVRGDDIDAFEVAVRIQGGIRRNKMFGSAAVAAHVRDRLRQRRSAGPMHADDENRRAWIGCRIIGCRIQTSSRCWRCRQSSPFSRDRPCTANRRFAGLDPAAADPQTARRQGFVENIG